MDNLAPSRSRLRSLWVLVPFSLIGPLLVGILVQMLVGGSLRETPAYTAGIFLIYPIGLIAFIGVVCLQAAPGRSRIVVFLTAAASSLFWWLAMVVGSIAP